MDDAETMDDATRLRRSRSAGSDARSDHRGWFAKALARTFSSTTRIEEEAEREEGGVGTASGRRRDEEDEEDEEEKTPTSTPTSTPRKDARPSDDDDEVDDDETDDEDEDEDDERTPDEFHPLSPSASWFNPERLTAEKRRWLRDQRAASMDFDGESSLNAGANANANASSSLRMMESFLVCGLEPSPRWSWLRIRRPRRRRRASGAANDVAITDPRRLRAYRGTAGATYTASILLQYPP